ncbi:MAG: hypothetical protein OXG92_03405 [Chloroflexi bacterium]|nr:hypothetical protein [Chloroflexota bacterium]MCY3715500.1 hypothetical protein [Chloroflexota bacterium]MDE2651231.1 hypothetical protein [Chloroflexota bacterium]MYA92129.1 CCA tRNA nucleotidyltransferase [Chloroflexota bacterium]MYC54559.1 CCA tRNA nucleotidyltransferase [Chloroflexota bacterium]
MSNPPARLAWSGFVTELAELLRARGVDTPLYLVGGVVRDAWLRKPTDDIDIVVGGRAIPLARRVCDWLGADIYVMDRERGVARVFVKQAGRALSLDFADQRGSSLAEDLRDRDFTMNAMAADLLGDCGALVDPLAGEQDLRAKVLRRCSPNSIAADPIRGLRAVRFSAQFDLKIEPATAADIRGCTKELRATSPERIRDEFFKLLGLGRAARGLRVLEHLGLLRMILPDIPPANLPHSLAVVERLATLLTAISRRRTDNTAAAFDLGMLVIQLDRFRPRLQAHLDRRYGNWRNHAQLLALAALLEAGNQAALVAESLRLSAGEARILSQAVSNELVDLPMPATRLEQHRYWQRLGAGGIDVILLGAAKALAAQGVALDQQDWLRRVEQITQLLDAWFNQYDTLVNPKLLLSGHDVKTLLDIQSGPQIGVALTALREAQALGKVTTQEQARAFLAQLSAIGSAPPPAPSRSIREGS